MPKIPFPRKKVSRAVALEELAILERTYPNAVTALDYRDPWTLLIAVILSAQSTDAGVNKVTPVLFKRYPTPQALARARPAEVEKIVKSTGFFRTKARNIVNASKAIVESYGAGVPRDRESLESLPGVGRKTAGVVMSVAFGEAAFAVDTHVFRVSHRLGLTLGKTPREVEEDVTKIVPREKWRFAHHWLILHGRQICKAQRPLCERCPVNKLCPTAKIVRVLIPRSAAVAAATKKR
ncbi:MAG TPA: endonuclease III [Candidatus Binatia bacterium]|nr:endonuclease III [Candidatus Binatia bacterium]